MVYSVARITKSHVPKFPYSLIGAGNHTLVRCNVIKNFGVDLPWF